MTAAEARLTLTLKFQGQTREVKLLIGSTLKGAGAAIREVGRKIFGVAAVQLTLTELPIDHSTVKLYKSTRMTGFQQAARRMKLPADAIGKTTRSRHPGVVAILGGVQAGADQVLT